MSRELTEKEFRSGLMLPLKLRAELTPRSAMLASNRDQRTTLTPEYSDLRTQNIHLESA